MNIYFTWGSCYIKDGVKLIFQPIGMAPPSGSLDIAVLADELEELTVDGDPGHILQHFTAVLVSCSDADGQDGINVSWSSYCW